jgi:acetylornithine/N-succinyldiaminopimelate aminotransferase
MIGITLKNKDAHDVAQKALERGLLVLTAKEKVRLLPPLTISYDELKDGLKILIEILEE